jgi:polysaccharide deacetylase family protein (PEP-CTERM system associated)
MNNNFFSVDVEDWFNILDCDQAPLIDQWAEQDIYFQKPLNDLLAMLDATKTQATFFWLAWFAERYPDLVRRCYNAGHEIASHGYGHVLAYQAGRKVFAEDIKKSKKILENIIQAPVNGFRAAGFSTLNDTMWTFEEIKDAGYLYDSSVFPASRGHGGMHDSKLEPHLISTKSGDLLEFPQSMIEILGKRVSFFGGGYLRLAPLSMIKWGIKQLKNDGRPLIVYIHPREVDPAHPRLTLPFIRRFKCYVNLKSTMKKLEWICKNHDFITMNQAIEIYC